MGLRLKLGLVGNGGGGGNGSMMKEWFHDAGLRLGLGLEQFVERRVRVGVRVGVGVRPDFGEPFPMINRFRVPTVTVLPCLLGGGRRLVYCP